MVSGEGIAGSGIRIFLTYSGLFTVYLYTKLWIRADVIVTGVGCIGLRYGGKPAGLLCGFRASELAFPGL